MLISIYPIWFISKPFRANTTSQVAGILVNTGERHAGRGVVTEEAVVGPFVPDRCRKQLTEAITSLHVSVFLCVCVCKGQHRAQKRARQSEGEREKRVGRKGGVYQNPNKGRNQQLQAR